MQQILTMYPLSEAPKSLRLVHPILGLRDRRKSNTPQIAYFDIEPQVRPLARAYQIPELDLSKLSPNGSVESSTQIKSPGPSRQLRTAPLPPGQYEVSFLGPNDEEISFPIASEEGQAGSYRIAAAVGLYTPPVKPRTLRHFIYHGWSR